MTETPAEEPAGQRKSRGGTVARGQKKRAIPRWEGIGRERLRSALRKFSRPLSDLQSRNANEADTRLLVTDFLTEALGFDKYSELNTEYRVKSEYVDYSIRLDGDMLAFVEVKRISAKLAQKHLPQVQSYAVNEGVEWMILTNGAEWQVYHLSGGLPIAVDLVMEADLLADTPPGTKVDRMFCLTREAMRRRTLEEVWEERRATSPDSLAAILLSASVLTAVRKELRKRTSYRVSIDEIGRLVKETCLRPECLEKDAR